MPKSSAAGSASRSPRRGDGAPATVPEVEIRRSARRRRTITAYREGDLVVVLMPARMSRAAEQHWVEVMLARLAAQDRRRGGRAARGDAELGERASALSQQYLGARARPTSVRWVSNQLSRWGSCTPADGTIRLSDRLRSMPSWVVDYVLVHELAHLLDASHGPRFQALVGRYPETERARGYLLGVVEARGGGDEEVDDADVAPPGGSAAPVVLDSPVSSSRAAAARTTRRRLGPPQADALW